MRYGLTNIYGNVGERLLLRMLRRMGDTPAQRKYVLRHLAEKWDVEPRR